MAGSLAHVLPVDVQAASDVLADWQADPTAPALTPAALGNLRGRLAGLLADVRDAAYLEGTIRGRRDVAQLVVSSLQDEGLLG